MKKSSKFSPEVRERAVRMVQEQRGEYPSLWAAIESIASKIGCTAETLRKWVQRGKLMPEREPGRASTYLPQAVALVAMSQREVTASRLA